MIGRLMVLGGLLVAGSYAPGQMKADRTERLRAVVADAHARGEFDGVVVISEGGKPVFTAAEGFAGRVARTPNKVETVFRLASLTKQVTALLVMQEVVAGKIRLDERAGEIVPGLPEASGRVTVKQLLQHVSGLVNPSDGPDNVMPAFYTRTDADAANMTKTAKGFCSGTAKAEPGGRFEYNNCDYIVLGAVLERVSGMTYEELVRAKVIEPLGLKSWGVFMADPRKAPKVAVGYMANGVVEEFQNPAVYGSAGGLYGNALDVAKWDEALLTYRLLSKEATEMMFRADPKLYGEAMGSWAYDSKAGDPPAHIVERQGDIGGTRLLNLLMPGKGMSMVIIANTEKADLFNTYSGQGLAYALLKALYGAP